MLTPGCGAGVNAGAGVGAFVTLPPEMCPVGTVGNGFVEFLFGVHDGTLQQSGSAGSATRVQPAGILVYEAHLKAKKLESFVNFVLFQVFPKKDDSE